MVNRIVKALVPEYTTQQSANSVYKFSLQFVINLVWLFSSVFLVYYLGFEKNKGFDKVAILLTSAFLVYVFVPLRFRKLFLAGLAFAIEVYLIGLKLSACVFLVIVYFVGLTYVKNKHLRLLSIFVSVALGVLVVSKFWSLPHLRFIFMVSAVFLMLRYIYFLYELNYFKKPPVFIDRLCYLFLIPNACFPLFPALNPNEFQNTFYNQPSEISMKRGLHWITVGIFHLLIYRVIYLYFTPSPYDIDGFPMWGWFILSSYSLIFRLSGLFYLAMGFLQIFGFNLPNIFNHVYFANSFPDLWRRVNLYWRAFMIRVFYYPIVFKFKKQNQRLVVGLVTLLMFGFTWLLHSWQWYWIKGSYYFYPTDMIFWFTLGLIISYNAVRTIDKLNNTKPVKAENYYVGGAKVVLMFVAMSLLWSMWTASSVTEFFYISKFVLAGTMTEYVCCFVLIILVMLIAGLIRWLHYKRNWFGFVFLDTKPVYGIMFSVLVFSSIEFISFKGYKAAAENFINMNVNARDKILLERGYYEQILNNDDKSIELLNVGSKFKKWNLDRDAYQRTENELIKEFIPNYKTTFKGDTLYTNSFGLRDKEYSIQKDSTTTRIAFVGGSYVMGSGVSNEENFAALLEERMNRSGKVEILNYGVGGYFLIQNVYQVEKKVVELSPDYVFCFIHSSYRSRCLDNFANLILKNVPLTNSYLNEIIERTGIKKGMCHLEIYNRLKPFINEIVDWGFRSIYTASKNKNITPVMVYLPANAGVKEDDDKGFCLMKAGKIGFHTVDLSEVYDGQNPQKIQLSAWDTHPNEKGHQLIADLLFEKLKKDKQFFKFMD